MKVYIVIRAALQELGEFCKMTIEKCYSDKAKAEKYLSEGPIAWTEKYEGVNYVLERSVCEAEVE